MDDINPLVQRYFPNRKKYRTWHVLSALINEFSLKTMVEIGCAKGDNAHEILQSVKDPEFKLFCVDPYESYSDYSEDRNAVPETIKRNYQLIKKRVFSVDKRSVHWRMYSEDAAIKCDNELIQRPDIIFIDANHKYEYVKKDILAWKDLISSRGFFTGHDYRRKNGVVTAIKDIFGDGAIQKTYDSVWILKRERREHS